jgi:hypothetical protein
MSNPPSPIVLHSDRLTVEVAALGTLYRGSRFDWTAFITQISLDGKHSFCVPESLQPGLGSGGWGLCNEFGIDQPIGYDEAAPGQPFPKLGIGLLARPDAAPYNFGRPHVIAQPFPIHVDATPQQVRFTVEPVDCRGYAGRLTKTVSVKGNELRTDYRLDNTGTRPLQTVEYCHNFVAVDRQPVGPVYELRLPVLVETESPAQVFANVDEETVRRIMGVLDIAGDRITWREKPQTSFYCRIASYTRTDQPQWELVHQPSGAGLREFDDFMPVRIALWGTDHVISPEIFVGVDVQPGQTQAWSRRWEFFGN